MDEVDNREETTTLAVEAEAEEREEAGAMGTVTPSPPRMPNLLSPLHETSQQQPSRLACSLLGQPRRKMTPRPTMGTPASSAQTLWLTSPLRLAITRLVTSVACV